MIPHRCLHLPDTGDHLPVTVDLLPQALKQKHLSVGRRLDVPMIFFFFFSILKVAFSFLVMKIKNFLVEVVRAFYQWLHENRNCWQRAGRESQHVEWEWVTNSEWSWQVRTSTKSSAENVRRFDRPQRGTWVSSRSKGAEPNTVGKTTPSLHNTKDKALED